MVCVNDPDDAVDIQPLAEKLRGAFEAILPKKADLRSKGRSPFMNKESKYLLHLLGAYLRKAEPQPEPGVDWGRLTELAYSHNLAGVLAFMGMQYPICPDPEHRMSLRRFYLMTITEFSTRGELAEGFSQILADNGIDHVLVKGIVLRDFFPVPELRTYGDVDLVIRRTDRQKSHALMEQLGFQTKTDWEPVYSYRKRSENYELHTELLETDVAEKTACRAYFRDCWSHVVPIAEHRFQFEPEYHFLYLLTHLAKHVTGSGAGIRMYMDVAAIILHYGENLDWAMIARELEVLDLGNFANVVFTMVQNCFGVASPIALKSVAADVLETFVELTMRGGIFGKNAQNSGTVAVRQESRGGSVSRVDTIVKRLFPSAKTIQSRYTYLQDKPWLLPVAWIHRLVITRGAWKEHTHQAGQILSVDREEAQRLIRLYREMGL